MIEKSDLIEIKQKEVSDRSKRRNWSWNFTLGVTIGSFKSLTPHGWGIAHDKKQRFGLNSSFKSVTIGFLWY